MKKLFILLLSFCALINDVVAQADNLILKDTININEVVVTGTTSGVNKNIIPLAISVVSRSQIAESNESSLLPVLSGRVPGLFVTASKTASSCLKSSTEKAISRIIALWVS